MWMNLQVEIDCGFTSLIFIVNLRCSPDPAILDDNQGVSYNIVVTNGDCNGDVQESCGSLLIVLDPCHEYDGGFPPTATLACDQVDDVPVGTPDGDFDNLDCGTTDVSVSLSCTEVDAVGSDGITDQLDCVLPQIVKGNSMTVEVPLTVICLGVGNEVTLTAETRYSCQVDIDGSNNFDQEDTAVIPGNPDLSVTIAAPSSVSLVTGASPDNQITFTVTLTNEDVTASADAAEVQLNSGAFPGGTETTIVGSKYNR